MILFINNFYFNNTYFICDIINDLKKEIHRILLIINILIKFYLRGSLFNNLIK